MQPHPKMRRAVKRVGTIVCIAIVAAWGLSVFYHARIGLGWGWETSLSHGQVGIGYWDTYHRWRAPRGLVVTRSRPDLRWQFEFHDPPLVARFWIPAWFVFAPVLTVTVAAWWLDTRARRRTNVCDKCGYDRTGLTAESRCPECGGGIQRAASAGEA